MERTGSGGAVRAARAPHPAQRDRQHGIRAPGQPPLGGRHGPGRRPEDVSGLPDIPGRLRRPDPGTAVPEPRADLDALRRFTGEEDVSGRDAGLVPDFERHSALVRTALAALEEAEQAQFTAKTATSRTQQEEAERRRTKYADQAISAEYNLRYLRRDLRDAGATPPRPASRAGRRRPARTRYRPDPGGTPLKGSTHRRCYCRDPHTGKPLGKSCPSSPTGSTAPTRYARSCRPAKTAPAAPSAAPATRASRPPSRPTSTAYAHSSPSSIRTTRTALSG
ncbi:hypothetical protein SRIMM317S_06223 [Streptomyces rimosus subsp. rimosus]